MFFCKAGLEIGEMILAVNKDSLLGSNYDTVNIHLISCSTSFWWRNSHPVFAVVCCVCTFHSPTVCSAYVPTSLESLSFHYYYFHPHGGMYLAGSQKNSCFHKKFWHFLCKFDSKTLQRSPTFLRFKGSERVQNAIQ